MIRNGLRTVTSLHRLSKIHPALHNLLFSLHLSLSSLTYTNAAASHSSQWYWLLFITCNYFLSMLILILLMIPSWDRDKEMLMNIFFYYCCNNVNNWMPPPLPSFFWSLIYFPFHQMFFKFSCFVICPLLLFKILSLAHYDALGFKCQNNKFFKYDTWVCFRLFSL